MPLLSTARSFARNLRLYPSSRWRVTTWFVIAIMSLQTNTNTFWDIFSLNMFSSVLNIFVHCLSTNVPSYSLFPQQHIPLKEIFKTSWKLHSHTWWETGIFMLVTTQISCLCWNRRNIVQLWWASSLNLIIFCSASSSNTHWRICTYWAS